MFAKTNDELEDDFEDTEDTDLEDKNSDDEEELTDDEDDADTDTDEDLSDEDKAKPMTRGEFKEWQKAERARIKSQAKKQTNITNAARRVSTKQGNLSDRTPKVSDRLATIELNQAKIDLIERKRQFAYENSLSPQETDIVFKLTKRPTKKFLEQPYVQGALTAIRSNKNVRDNTPGSGGRSSFKVGDKDFKDLKPDEKQDNFAARRRAILDSKKANS